ncbi:MAG TPA: fused MFS/spermidine synthase [Vicinamibacterales bacterium]|nr:fused MFS/spermidine synthase [Vicinamibacterales bacterium]
MFVIQPLFAKMALPHLGGSPAVWNTCVLFFQAVLLLAYLYAHLTVQWLGARGQAISHVALLLLPLFVLPIAVPPGGPPEGEGPTWWLLRMMTVRIGLPFFLVATMAPLVQRWFATLPLRSAADPYFLYAASNMGSMLALLAFPFFLEPAYGVRLQARGWVAGYGLLIALAAICAATAWRYGGSLGQVPGGAADRVPLTAWQRGWWVLLSFVPSSLMLGVTTHISTDLAAVPLLWIIPLSLYLATFILAFSTRQWVPDRLLARTFPLFALAAVASIVLRIGSPYLILLHLAAFFTCALVCHRRLARSRPPAAHLTEFYLWLSVGGVLGGIFNTLVAPHIFNGIYEYPLVLALGCLLRPHTVAKTRPEPWSLFAVTSVTPLAVCVGLWGFGASPAGASLRNIIVIALIVIGGFWAFAGRRAPFNALILGIALLVLGGFGGLPGNTLFADRSFFGVLKVIAGPQPGYHVLQHGTTLHGRQDTRVAGSCEPLSYYHRNGPVGQLFAEAGAQFRNIAVVGLGTGALACYPTGSQRMTFFEIDPMVVRIASDPRLFTYLQNSAGHLDVVVGDGRKMLELAPPGSFDLIVVDAFSSDSVPVHLMTREALEVYVSRLRPAGVIGFHISNRYLDLEGVLGATVAAAGLDAMVNRDVAIPDVEKNGGRSPSHWVLIWAQEPVLSAMRSRPGWSALKDDSRSAAWTDDYSNIVDALIAGRPGN